MDSLIKESNDDISFFLPGGSEMKELIRKHDWANSSVGIPKLWPAELKNTLGLMMHCPFPMFLFWGDELIQFYNDAYLPSLRDEAKHPKALGQRGEEGWQETWPTIYPFIQRVMENGESVCQENLLIPIYRNGELENVYWTFSYSPITNENADIKGVLVVCNETTRSVVAFQEMERAKEELEFAVEATELGTWDYNPVTNTFIGNDRLKKWFGIDAENEIDLSIAIGVIAENERDRVSAAIQQALTYGSGGIYLTEFTIIHPKNPVPRQVKAKGKALFNEERNAIRFSGTLQDITEEKTTDEEIRVGKKNLEQAYEQIRLSKDAAQLGLFDMDLKTGSLEWDARCRELFGISHTNKVTYEEDFLLGLHPDDRERVSKLIDNLFIKAISDGNYDVEYRTVGITDGTLRWVRAKGKVFFNEADEPVRFIGSVLDISDLKKDEDRKNAFIGIVSHELKTPLTTVKAYVQMLKDRAEKNKIEFETRALEKTEIQLTKMSTMIDGFLNLSRLESGKINLNIERFSIKDLVNEIISETLITITTHIITLCVCNDFYVPADRIKIGNVVSNLLSNGIKYSQKGKPINISCEQVENMVRIGVHDEGIGINVQDKEKLFNRFYRVQNNHTKHISGFGIGLYLSAEIIERHGGKIWVESEEGVGSVFYFTLLLA